MSAIKHACLAGTMDKGVFQGLASALSSENFTSVAWTTLLFNSSDDFKVDQKVSANVTEASTLSSSSNW